jgi:hypothetical protein
LSLEENIGSGKIKSIALANNKTFGDFKRTVNTLDLCDYPTNFHELHKHVILVG